MIFDKCQNFCGVAAKTEDLNLKKVLNGYIADDEESSSEYVKCCDKNYKDLYNTVTEEEYSDTEGYNTGSNNFNTFSNVSDEFTRKYNDIFNTANQNTEDNDTDSFNIENIDTDNFNTDNIDTDNFNTENIDTDNSNIENIDTDYYNVENSEFLDYHFQDINHENCMTYNNIPDKLNMKKNKIKSITENICLNKNCVIDVDTSMEVQNYNYGSFISPNNDDKKATPPKTTNRDYLKEPLLSKIKSKKAVINIESSPVSDISMNDQEVEGEDQRNNESTSNQEQLFPKEKGKTFLALLLMLLTLTLSLLSLSIAHDCVPNRQVYDPLPDRILNAIPEKPFALDIAEYIIMICTISVLLLNFFHKHRWIIFRRICFLMGILYLYRAITMQVTILPVPSKKYYCSPQEKRYSLFLIMKRICNLISGLGLSLNGKHTYCGDYIFSGHTVILTLSYLIISEYTPKRFRVIHILYALLGFFGVIMVLVAHGHYTIDVILAYYITTRLFWSYHHLANNHGDLKNNEVGYNYLNKEWWMCCFRYFEKNINGPIPCEYNWPFPWPRKRVKWIRAESKEAEGWRLAICDLYDQTRLKQ